MHYWHFFFQRQCDVCGSYGRFKSCIYRIRRLCVNKNVQQRKDNVFKIIVLIGLQKTSSVLQYHAEDRGLFYVPLDVKITLGFTEDRKKGSSEIYGELDRVPINYKKYRADRRLYRAPSKLSVRLMA